MEFIRYARHIGIIISSIGFQPHFLLKRTGNIQQTLQKQRIKHATLSRKNHLNSLLMGICRLIAAHTGKRIIYIRNRNSLGGNRDFLSLQTVRITAAIITLMMPAAYLIRSFHQGLILLIEGKLFQHISTCHRMPLHNCKFLSSQSAWFIQNLVRNGNLTNIMQRRSCTDQSNLFPAYIIWIILLLYQMTQKHICDHLDMENMKTTLTITELYDMRKNADHQLTTLLPLIYLVTYNICQPPLLSTQQNSIL